MKMNLFQAAILAIFGLLAVAAVLIFSSVQTGGGSLNFAGTFTVWGTLPADSVKIAVDNFNNANAQSFKIQYVQKNSATFENNFVSALASGTGPDIIIMPESLIVQNSDKILPIDYSLYSARNFNNDFADSAALFSGSSGMLGMPLYIDPLIMYWNKDLLSGAGVASHPTNWSQFGNLVSKLTIADSAGNISQSAVALGAYSNIQYAKEILAALFLQSGSVSGGSILGDPNLFNNNLASALQFFLDFSNPAKLAYSWNVSLPNSEQLFAGGTLATYFGLASDYYPIKNINPHLNFDVALLPQRDGATSKITFAHIYAAAVTRGAAKPDVAKAIAIAMSGADFVKDLSGSIPLPPARRDLLSAGSGDPAMSVFDSAAITGKSWLDPSPTESDQVFKDMVGSVASGGSAAVNAISLASQKLNNLVKTKN